MLRFALAAVAVLFLAGCTASETACLIAEEVKFTFDDEAARGAFSADEIVTVNSIYNEGIRVCTAPPGTYDQATVIRTIGSVTRVIRRVMAQNEVAYQAMGPQLRRLDQLLKEARQ